jgi:polyhydroxyalkanoate synthesis repressor PhaR
MPRTVKKYANRRLYDTEASRHVTLDGIRQLVAGGEDVVVIDDTTGEDITRSILLQVIAEQEQGGRPILSVEMLRHIIRFYGNPLQELMGGYLERSLDVFMAAEGPAGPDPEVDGCLAAGHDAATHITARFRAGYGGKEHRSLDTNAENISRYDDAASCAGKKPGQRR